MLHRNFLIFSLVVTFCLAQLGLIAHDISHLHQTSTQGLQGQVVGQTNANQDIVENTSDHSAFSKTNLALDDTKNVSPQTAEPHVCENCVGFAAMAMAAVQSPFVLSLHQEVSLPVYFLQKFNLYTALRYQSARAPPTYLS